MELVKPSQAEVGKVYRVVETTYPEDKYYPVYKGCLVKITSKTIIPGCYAVPVNDEHSENFVYYDKWGGIEEMFEGPIGEMINNAVSASTCPECREAGEFVAMAYKCPKCWKVWQVKFIIDWRELIPHLAGWWNGRHRGLKIPCPLGRAGSTPAPATNMLILTIGEYK